jgi:hypothetical protein
VFLNDTSGIDILGSLVEPSRESAHPEYYGALHNYGHILLGQITDPKGKFDVSMTSFLTQYGERQGIWAVCIGGAEPSSSAARDRISRAVP